MTRKDDPMVVVFDTWLRSAFGDAVNATDAPELARLARSSVEFRRGRQALDDLRRIGDLLDVIKREREASDE